MEVRITFDTEKESIDELKRLISSLQDLIKKRERAINLKNPLASASVKMPSEFKEEKKQENTSINQFSQDTRTSGGGRIVPYDENISDSLAKILSGKK